MGNKFFHIYIYMNDLIPPIDTSVKSHSYIIPGSVIIFYCVPEINNNIRE